MLENISLRDHNDAMVAIFETQTNETHKTRGNTNAHSKRLIASHEPFIPFARYFY